MDAQSIISQFQQRFKGEPLVVRSPGRINLIGEHTDYNQGFVLPAAIDKEIVWALAGNQSSQCNIYSLNLEQEVTFPIGETARSEYGWANYIIGVIQQLLDHEYPLQGFDAVFGGDIPIGAGLSSSAALECGIGYGLDQLCNLGLEREQIVAFALEAENSFVGVNCGVMDQFANMFGKTNRFIRLDCRDLSYEYVDVKLQGYCLALFNSNVKHQHGSSEYNIRRQECESGVAKIKEIYPEVRSLRDCTSDMLDLVPSLSGSKIYRRCKYVIQENQRVIEGCKDLACGRLQKFGSKMYASHDGLSTQYEVSCPEMDLLVELTRDLPAILGARMMGGGFGGCTINLIREDQAQSITKVITEEYLRQTGMKLIPYQVKTADGTSLKHLAKWKHTKDKHYGTG